MENNLNKCPQCGGDIILMTNPFHYDLDCDCFARCTNCKKEYELPSVKLKILKNLRISKTTLHEAESAWNKQQNENPKE